MPPAGWYPDPEQAWTWRYWDGARWSDYRAPVAAPPGRNPYSLSVWFEESFATFKAVARRAGLLIASVWLVSSALFGVLVVVVFNSSNGREIRSLIDFDRTFMTTGSSQIELTDAEWERVGDLFVDTFWSALPWLLALWFVVALAWLWSTALAARIAHRVADDSVGAVSRTDDAADSIRRVPAVIGACCVLAGISAGVLALGFVPLMLALALDGGGTSAVLAGVFGLPAALVAVMWLAGRLSLAVALASIGGHGIGIRRSWELTGSHFWGVVGRLILAAVIAGSVTSPLSLLSNVGSLFGDSAALVSLLLVQAVAITMSTLISVPAAVVIVRHLTEQREGRIG